MKFRERIALLERKAALSHKDHLSAKELSELKDINAQIKYKPAVLPKTELLYIGGRLHLDEGWYYAQSHRMEMEFLTAIPTWFMCRVIRGTNSMGIQLFRVIGEFYPTQDLDDVLDVYPDLQFSPVPLA